jgi:hypothetical protein
MVYPFEGRRSIEGVEVVERPQSGSELVFIGYNWTSQKSPAWHSTTGKDEYHLIRTDRVGRKIENAPPRPAALPILDSGGNEYPLKFKDWFEYVFYEGKWVDAA